MITGGGNRTTWQLNLTPPALPASSSKPVIPPATQLSFLGYGILYPLTRGKGNDFASGGGAPLVKSRVKNILGTRAGVSSTQGTAAVTGGGSGELPWRGEFGSRASLLRHKSNTRALGKFAQQYVLDALAAWEPCVRVAFATLAQAPSAPRVLGLRVLYDIVTTSPAGNQVVFPQQDAEVPLSASAS